MSTPRWLDEDAAARYVSVTSRKFWRLIRSGVIPKPSYAAGPREPRWDRLALDAVFVEDVESTNPEVAFNALIEEIAAGR